MVNIICSACCGVIGVTGFSFFDRKAINFSAILLGKLFPVRYVSFGCVDMINATRGDNFCFCSATIPKCILNWFCNDLVWFL